MVGLFVIIVGVIINCFCFFGLQVISMVVQCIIVDGVLVVVVGGLDFILLVQNNNMNKFCVYSEVLKVKYLGIYLLMIEIVEIVVKCYGISCE